MTAEIWIALSAVVVAVVAALFSGMQAVSARRQARAAERQLDLMRQQLEVERGEAARESAAAHEAAAPTLTLAAEGLADGNRRYVTLEHRGGPSLWSVRVVATRDVQLVGLGGVYDLGPLPATARKTLEVEASADIWSITLRCAADTENQYIWTQTLSWTGEYIDRDSFARRRRTPPPDYSIGEIVS